MKKLLTAIMAAAISVSAWADLTPTDNIKLALNMYSNQRARQVGDLLTVTIEESNTSKKTEDLKTEKTIKANADAPFFGYNASNANFLQKIHNFFVKAVEQSYTPVGPEYKVEASSSFDGKGSTNSTDLLQSEFTVRVVDVLENGVLVVRGDRKVMIRLETVSMVVTGLVRTRDIDSDNKVSSTRLADAHIYYETGGETSRGTRPGYLWRVFQFLNPW
jgi:flagellar L-ring protein precursor FlgH